jgi:hypothetical protein
MANVPPEPASAPFLGERIVRRISFLIPTFGISAGVLAGLLHHWDWAEGLVLGSALAWLNFHWLRRGLGAFTSAVATANNTKRRRASPATYLAAAFRYALIGLALYVIFKFLHVSLVSLAVGLCAFAAAIITAAVWEIVQSVE